MEKLQISIPRNIGMNNGVVELKENKSVLDFGCGRGDLMEYIKATSKSVYGIDISSSAIEIVHQRNMPGHVATVVTDSKWDIIVCTEVLEHLDNDKEMLENFFEHTDCVVYTVPENCLPPGLEKEHRRVYTERHITEITPFLKEIHVIDDYYLVIAYR